MITAPVTDNRLVYLDTGEIFEADDDGIATGDPVATMQVALLDDDEHALGQAMASAPDMLNALEQTKKWLGKLQPAVNTIASEIIRDIIADHIDPALAKASGA